MDTTEIIRYGTQIAKSGAELAGAWKLTSAFKAILGPASAEFGEMVHDQFRAYRFGRQVECLRKAEEMVKKAGLTPKAVPIKILFPLLEAASLEENEDLDTMWSALLANAAAGKIEKVRPAFFEILKQMASDEAVLLKTIGDLAGETVEMHKARRLELRTEEQRIRDGRRVSLNKQQRAAAEALKDRYRQWKQRIRVSIEREGEEADASEIRYATCLQLLNRAGLIIEENRDGLETIALSPLGQTLMDSCRPPQAIGKPVSTRA